MIKFINYKYIYLLINYLIFIELKLQKKKKKKMENEKKVINSSENNDLINFTTKRSRLHNCEVVN